MIVCKNYLKKILFSLNKMNSAEQKNDISEVTDDINLNDFDVNLPKGFTHSKYSKNGIIIIPVGDLQDYIDNKQDLHIEFFCDTGKPLSNLSISYRTGSNQISNVLKDTSPVEDCKQPESNNLNSNSVMIIVVVCIIFIAVLYAFKNKQN
jgi:hypothetical protein